MRNPVSPRLSVTSSTGLSGPEKVCPSRVVVNKLRFQGLWLAEWGVRKPGDYHRWYTCRERSIWVRQQK